MPCLGKLYRMDRNAFLSASDDTDQVEKRESRVNGIWEKKEGADKRTIIRTVIKILFITKRVATQVSHNPLDLTSFLK